MAHNPIIPGFNPDPSVCRVGEDYYLATSTFEYFPGVPIYHSKDLVNWKVIGHCLTRPSQLCMTRVEPGGGIFAPTLRHHKGRFYMATSCVMRHQSGALLMPRGFYVQTDNIFDSSAWSEPIYFDTLGIDQDLFFDDDDRVYLSVSFWKPVRESDEPRSAVIMCSEIDLTGRNLTTPTELRRSTFGMRCAEGPHIYKINGWYYLLTAEGGTEIDHQARIFRSKHPLGPYEEPPEGLNPIIHNGFHQLVRNTGHADFVQTPNGDWWVYFLGTRLQENGLAPLGRETFIAPLAWEDGWPVVNGRKPIDLGVIPSLPSQSPARKRDDFDKDILSVDWYFLRNPVKQFYSFTEKKGWLAIRGNGFTIADPESPALLVQKQTCISGTWSTLIDFVPTTQADEAGIAVFWSCYAFAALLIRKSSEDSREIVLRWIDEDSEAVKTREEVQPLKGNSPLVLTITSAPTFHTFSYSYDGEEKLYTMGKLSTAVLERRRQFDSIFTGTHYGIFAQGLGGCSCMDAAYFKYTSFDAVCHK